MIINYDDSDGWYDHANSGVINPSLSLADNLTEHEPDAAVPRRVSAAPTRRRPRRSAATRGAAASARACR